MESIFIPIPLPKPEFRSFFCSYLIEGPPTCLVDVGPYSGHKELKKRLYELGVTSIEYILLTHIHIDHAGALGPILEAYPKAKAVCHELGLRFIPNPDSFWDASLRVLKDRAMEYGKPEPVPIERLLSHKEAKIPGVSIIPTPGHASHHISFITDTEIFAGEAAGNHFTIRENHYLRPATPPRFFLDQAIRSVESLMETGKEIICYAHCGKSDSAQKLLNEFRAQLKDWHIWVDEMLKKKLSIDEIADELVRRDHRLNGFHSMSIEEQNREREFIKNSILGFKGYVEEKRV